jgi:molybdate transport system substrate-binding protein
MRMCSRPGLWFNSSSAVLINPTTMPTTIRVISSMATKPLLADLVKLFQAQAPQYEVQVESVGGVDAAKRVQAGEAFDCVVLASNAIDTLLADGKLAAGSRTDLVHSGVAVAVPAGADQPDISTEAALKAAILAARTLGYSTGPSGVQLAKQFDRWGITDQIKDRIVQAQPGVPVGALIARGDVALGFQQLSEMMGVQGITVLGPLPDAVQITTTFSGGVATTSAQPEAVRALLAFWQSPACAALKRQHGMEAA